MCENVVYNGKERLDRFFLEIELEQQAAVVSGVGDRVKKVAYTHDAMQNQQIATQRLDVPPLYLTRRAGHLPIAASHWPAGF